MVLLMTPSLILLLSESYGMCMPPHISISCILSFDLFLALLVHSIDPFNLILAFQKKKKSESKQR